MIGSVVICKGVWIVPEIGGVWLFDEDEGAKA